jgi:hypothetical protein
MKNQTDLANVLFELRQVVNVKGLPSFLTGFLTEHEVVTGFPA